MFCPMCGDTLVNVNGELTCVRGGMGLSRDMERRLAECYVARSRRPREARATFQWGGTWHCPGCGVRAEEREGTVRCPQCGLCMNEFLFLLIERHPHR